MTSRQRIGLWFCLVAVLCMSIPQVPGSHMDLVQVVLFLIGGGMFLAPAKVRFVNADREKRLRELVDR